jgi:hypothetical protein
VQQWLHRVENISRISIRRKAKPNQVLEQMGVPYAPRPIPDFDASQAATMKGKRELLKKPVAKKGEGCSWLDHIVQNSVASIHNRAVKENRHRKDSSAKSQTQASK